MIRTKLILARFDKEGQLVEWREQEVRSWLKHFFDLLYPVHTLTNLANINDIGGVARTLQQYKYGQCHLIVGSSSGNIQLILPSATSTTTYTGDFIGIQVGTSALAVTPTQDALQGRITHGEAAGQLLYGGCELYGLKFINPNGEMSIRRYFTNVLGGAISVQEVGIYSPGRTTIPDNRIFCIARDVVSPGVTILDGEILRVTYVPQVTV